MRKSTQNYGKYFEIILKEMCKRVNADYNQINFNTDEWMEKYTWTIKEEIDFQDWLINFLVFNPEALKSLFDAETTDVKTITSLVKGFTLYYGWDISDQEDLSLDSISENNPNKN